MKNTKNSYVDEDEAQFFYTMGGSGHPYLVRRCAHDARRLTLYILTVLVTIASMEGDGNTPRR